MFIQCKQKVTKLVYDNMIEQTDVFPTKAYQKHKSELDTELSKEDFFNLFLNTLSSTASTKLRDIQFRILHHTCTWNNGIWLLIHALISTAIYSMNHLSPGKMAAILSDQIFKWIFLNENDRIPFEFQFFPGVQ